MSGNPNRENRDSDTVKRKPAVYCWIGWHDLEVKLGRKSLLASVEFPGIKQLLGRGANADMCGQSSGIARQAESAHIARTRKKSSSGSWITTDPPRRVGRGTDFEVNIDILSGLMIVPG